MFISRLENYLESLGKQHYEKQYLVNCLKEYIQLYVLECIYNDSSLKKFIFTGGTALQKCFGLDRLSEDIDVDSPTAINHTLISERIGEYFKNAYGYKDLSVSVKGRQKTIYLKFPVLKQLSLSEPNESEQVFVKIDIAPLVSDNYSTRISVINRHNINVLVKHYDLPSLFAGKLHAVVTRSYFKGRKSEIAFKGRDFYDLFWFLNRKEQPNYDRLNDLLRASGNNPCSPDELKELLLQRVVAISARGFLFDVQHLFQNRKYIKEIAENYQAIVLPLIEEM
ncbi:MAG: nucleotidyl transferase AbiEii/AbiGii toxin family protein [Proteobacteria bacterium]|nr:nucleotidyl transferase AbiEii/AbiGii toxin family protein [Pseudomonadota bacterium]